MIIKLPKPGLGFGIRDLGFWDLVWLGLGVAINHFFLIGIKKEMIFWHFFCFLRRAFGRRSLDQPLVPGVFLYSFVLFLV